MSSLYALSVLSILLHSFLRLCFDRHATSMRLPFDALKSHMVAGKSRSRIAVASQLQPMHYCSFSAVLRFVRVQDAFRIAGLQSVAFL